MFDLFALLTLLASMLAPIGSETGWAPDAATEESSVVTALDDGNMPPPGKR
jgi:hypothetical protein